MNDYLSSYSSLSAKGTDEKIKRVIGKLEFLSEISEHDKVWANKEHPGICKDTWGNSFMRFIYGENRQKAISFISQAYHEALELLESFIKDVEDGKHALNWCFILINKLEKSKDGPTNLMITYEDDKDIVSKLKAELEMLDVSLRSQQQRIAPYAKSKQKFSPSQLINTTVRSPGPVQSRDSGSSQPINIPNNSAHHQDPSTEIIENLSLNSRNSSYVMSNDYTSPENR